MVFSLLSKFTSMNHDLILFFIFVIFLTIFVIINRKKFIIQKLLYPVIWMGMYRTTWGLKLMDKIAEKYRNLIKFLAICGIGIGFIGMIYVIFTILKTAFDFLLAPKVTETGVALIIPGMNIPGLGIISFFHWAIALTVLVIVHEFSHGVVARAYKLKIKSSGFAFLSILLPIIPAAFVEPDEKELAKQSSTIQNSVFVAGPISNVLLALLMLAITLAILFPIHGYITDETGVKIDIINSSLPAGQAGMVSGEIITGINGYEINNTSQIIDVLNKKIRPDEQITVTTSNATYSLTTIVNPGDETKPYIGINNLENHFTPLPGFKIPYLILEWIIGLIYWTGMLSFLIGLINLLPIFITDGGQMVTATMKDLVSDKKKALKYSAMINLLMLLSLLLLVFGKLFQYVIGKF